jgi:hypothetical protein
MNSNSSSIVISFSIAILLLLILLLLISYNSKCKMDNIERFENETGTIGDILNQDHRQQIKSDARFDKPDLNAASGSVPIGKVYASEPSNASYATASGAEYYENVNLPNPNSISNMSDIPPPSLSSAPYSIPPVPVTTNQIEGFVGNNTCFDRDRLTSSDLLPMDAANSKWAQINPAGSGMLGDQNFLTAGYHLGINTIGQSLRNANLQLRSEPPNPQVAVSPWGISTIEPDIRTTTLEIGSAPSH